MGQFAHRRKAFAGLDAFVFDCLDELVGELDVQRPGVVGF
jgi:hypothetical protein